MASPFRDFVAQVAIKLGTGAQTPVGTDCFAVIKDSVKYDHEVDMTPDTSIRGNHMQFPDIPGSRMGRLSFGFYLKGSGTAGTAPEWGDCLRASRLNEAVTGGVSVIYKPLISEVQVATLWYMLDGIKFALNDAVINPKFTGERGKPWRVDCEAIGSMVDPTDTALLGSTSFDTTIPVAFQGVSVTISGVTTAPARKLSFDLGNVNGMRDDIAAASGYLGAFNSARRTVGQVEYELPTVAAHDIWTKLKNATTGSITHAALGTAGNIIQFAATVGQFTKHTLNSDSGRVYVTSDFLCAGAAATTEGDDFKLTLT